MSRHEEFIKILKKERDADVLPFFKSLSDHEKAEFTAELKTICTDYLEYKQVTGALGVTLKRKATDTQAEMLTRSILICFNRKDFEKHGFVWGMKSERITEILEWFCPKWFGDYLKSFTSADWMPNFITYDWLLQLSQRNIFHPSPELIAKTLPQTLFDPTRDHKHMVRPERLLTHPITLDQHIWLIFEMDTNVYLSDRYLQFADGSKKDESQWTRVLVEFAKQGKLDRARLLKASLLATAKNFNKNASGWFANLFEALEPNVEDLVSLQSELLNTFNSGHSKPINVSLNAIKKIADHPGFNADRFIESSPLLLASETKSIVISAIAIFEKLAKRYSEKRDLICIELCQAFIVNDDTIQTRASKAIAKFSSGSQEVRDAINQYKVSLLTNARTNLSQYLSGESGSEENSLTLEVESVQLIAINEVETLDELIFLASQAFDNNQPHHIDLLPAALLKLDHIIRGKEISKLEPAFQRALKLMTDGGVSTTGHLDNLLATFFVTYCNSLIKKFKTDAASLSEVYLDFAKKDAEKLRNWSWWKSALISLNDWQTPGDDPIYRPHKELLLIALNKIETGDTLPMLSTPTHEPALIDARVLLHRVTKYDSAGQSPNPIDLEVAISRTDLHSIPNSANLSIELQSTALKQLFRFHLLNGQPPAPIGNLKTAFLAAAALKNETTLAQIVSASDDLNEFTGQYSWTSKDEPQLEDRYNYEKRRYEKVPVVRKRLIIDLKRNIVKDNVVTNLISSLTKKIPVLAKAVLPTSLYGSIRSNSKQFVAHNNDVARLLYLVPNNPEPVLVQVMSKSMTYNHYEAFDQRLITSSLAALLPLNVRYQETGHLFIATCMLASDKTIQSFAGELWIKHALTGNIDSARLGEILGIHESHEFAPLKRLTDLISSNLMNVSGAHNVELTKLLTHLILRLPSDPITNLKKLLEIYFELISTNKIGVPEGLGQRISAWIDKGTLKKVVNAILSTSTSAQK